MHTQVGRLCVSRLLYACPHARPLALWPCGSSPSGTANSPTAAPSGLLLQPKYDPYPHFWCCCCTAGDERPVLQDAVLRHVACGAPGATEAAPGGGYPCPRSPFNAV